MTHAKRARAYVSQDSRSPTDFRSIAAAVALLVVLLLPACGQSPGISLTVDSATAEVLRGSDVTIDVTLARSGGAAGDVALSITGLPANVTASFSPAALSGSTLASVLTLSATAAAAEGSHDLTITGTGTSLSATTGVSLSITSLTIAGRVASVNAGSISGAKVSSQGVEATTDGTGAFSLAGLAVPYDLSIWNTTGEWVHIYEGLTTSQPLVSPPYASSSVFYISRSATLTGNLTGGQIPVDVDQHVLVCVEGLTVVVLQCDFVSTGGTSYAMNINWRTFADLDVRVHALQIEHDGVAGFPVAYRGYTSAVLTLTDGVPASADLDLGTALATTAVAVELESPLPIGGMVAGVEFGPNLLMLVAAPTSGATSHEVLMPVIDGVSYTFAAGVTASQPGLGWTRGVTGSTATVELPNILQSVSPPDGTTGVTTATSFTVVNPDGGPITHTWRQVPGDFAIGLTTMNSSSTLPDLAPYGLTLPAGTDLRWQPFAHSGTSSEGASIGNDQLYSILSLAILGAAPALPDSGTFVVGEEREFTTAP